MDVVAGRHHAGAVQQRRADFRHALVGVRRHGDDRLAALRERCAVDEVDLSADARPEFRAQRVGAHLARQVDLQGRVDGHEAVVLRDDVGVVRVSDIHHQHARVVVDEVVNGFRTHQEGRDHLAGVGFFGFAVDHALLHQRQHAVGEHFGVDAEVLMAAQLAENRIRNGPDAHLERCAVLDQRGAVLADGRLDLVRLGEFRFDQRGVVLHEEVDLRGVDHGLTEGARNVFVHHGDHIIGALHGRQRGVDGGSERYEAVFVGRADLDHRHVARNGSAAVQTLCLAQENRNVIGIAALGYLADVRTHEEGVELEYAFEFRIGVGSGTLRVQVMDVHVLQFSGLAAFAHGVDQALGSRCHRAEVDMVARFDDLDGLFRSRKMDWVSHYCQKIVSSC